MVRFSLAFLMILAPCFAHAARPSDQASIETLAIELARTINEISQPQSPYRSHSTLQLKQEALKLLIQIQNEVSSPETETRATTQPRPFELRPFYIEFGSVRSIVVELSGMRMAIADPLLVATAYGILLAPDPNHQDMSVPVYLGHQILNLVIGTIFARTGDLYDPFFFAYRLIENALRASGHYSKRAIQKILGKVLAHFKAMKSTYDERNLLQTKYQDFLRSFSKALNHQNTGIIPATTTRVRVENFPEVRTRILQQIVEQEARNGATLEEALVELEIEPSECEKLLR